MITCSTCVWWGLPEYNMFNQELPYKLGRCNRADLHPMTSEQRSSSALFYHSGPDFSCRHAEKAPPPTPLQQELL